MENNEFEFVAITRKKSAEAPNDTVANESVVEKDENASVANIEEASAIKSENTVAEPEKSAVETAEDLPKYENTNISKNSENTDTSTVSSAEHEEVTQTVIPDKDDLDELTVAPVNELPPVKVHKKEKESVDSEPIDVFIKKLKKESRPIEIKKLINRACTALLVLLIAIPVLLLVYIIVTFIK